MATKVKPSRINATWTPQVWQVPRYTDEDTFFWWDGGGWDIKVFSSKYWMTQWDAEKWDAAKVQATETKSITWYGSITIENWVEWWLHELTAYGYSENVSPLPSWYVQYDYVSGNATVNTWLTWGNASFTVSWNQWAVRLRDNWTLVFLWVPCENDSNVVWFYDIISSSFKTPSSTLTVGNIVEWPTPDVPRPIMTNNWILKYNQWTSERYTNWQQETIKISYLW